MKPKRGPFSPNRQEVYSSIIPAMNLLANSASGVSGEASEKVAPSALNTSKRDKISIRSEAFLLREVHSLVR